MNVQAFLQGLAQALTLESIGALFLGTSIGLLVGFLPGMTGTMTIALMIPITFGMESIPAMMALLGVMSAAVYGGSITACLINVPGTPASIVTTFDGFPLTRAGKGNKACALAITSSLVGGLFSGIVLLFMTPLISKFALKCGPWELFSLSFFGLSIVSSLASENLVYGFISCMLGLILGIIGLSPTGGVQRFTFGIINLMDGIPLVPTLIGLFSIPEILTVLEENRTQVAKDITKVEGSLFLGLHEIKKLVGTWIRSSVIGTFVGVIPAVGPETSPFVAYDIEKKLAKDKSTYGNGEPRGVAASEAANNASAGGALVPLLTLGVPGSGSAAVLLGGLMMHGLQPGPMLFKNNAAIVYGILLAYIFAQIAMYLLGLIVVKFSSSVMKIPYSYMGPFILLLAIIGSYACSNKFSDVVLMLIIGIIFYPLKKIGLQAGPVVLALVLGPLMEKNFIQGMMISNWDFSRFFTRPFSCLMIILALVSLFAPILLNRLSGGMRSYDEA